MKVTVDIDEVVKELDRYKADDRRTLPLQWAPYMELAERMILPHGVSLSGDDKATMSVVLEAMLASLGSTENYFNAMGTDKHSYLAGALTGMAMQLVLQRKEKSEDGSDSTGMA